MFECIGVLFFLAVSTGIVWLAFLIKELKQTTINLAGEIKVKQEEFDKKVDALAGQVSGLDSKLDGEAGEIAGIVAGYKDEIQRLKDSQGENIDTTRLDELSNSLDAVGTRIGGLVDPIVADEPPQTAAETPAQTVDEQPAKADEVKTSQSEVAEFPAKENQNQSSDESASESSESKPAESDSAKTDSDKAESSSDKEADK